MAFTYLALNVVFCLAAMLLLVRRRRGTLSRQWWVTFAALFVLTLIFDSLAIELGLFSYAPDKILGVTFGIAPIEDFFYPVLACIIVPALWNRFGVHKQPAGQGGDVETLKKLFWVSRPISWPNTSYPFFVGFLLVSDWPLQGAQILTLIIGTLYFIAPYNLLMYGINDIFDYESDVRNPRKGGIEGMKESRALHPAIVKAVYITNIPFLLYLFVVSPWTGRGVLALVVFAAIAYSVKGLRFKEIPFLDSITSSFHFVGPLLFALSIVALEPSAIPWLIAFFLWGIASHAFGAVQDIIPDRQAGLRSVATLLGARTTVWMAAALYASAAFLVASQGVAYSFVALAGLSYVVNCVPYLFVTDKTSGETNAGWRRFLWLNYASGAIVSVTILAVTVGIF